MNQARFLARIAEPLEPARLPFFIKAPTRPRQMPGWYVELQAGQPTPLGSNVYFAQSALEELVAQEATV
jgi:hypothetical protein